MCWNKFWRSRNYHQEKKNNVGFFFWKKAQTSISRMQVIFTTPRALCGKIKIWVERANSRIEIFVGLILVVQLRDTVLANFIRYENLDGTPHVRIPAITLTWLLLVLTGVKVVCTHNEPV